MSAIIFLSSNCVITFLRGSKFDKEILFRSLKVNLVANFVALHCLRLAAALIQMLNQPNWRLPLKLILGQSLCMSVFGSRFITVSLLVWFTLFNMTW